MEEIAVTHVDAHMAVAGAGAEEHQVADADIITADFFAAFQQLGGGARYFHAQAGQEGEVDEAGAIHTAGAQATVAVGDAFPVFVLGFQSGDPVLCRQTGHRALARREAHLQESCRHSRPAGAVDNLKEEGCGAWRDKAAVWPFGSLPAGQAPQACASSSRICWMTAA
jgi:hypothetical protein